MNMAVPSNCVIEIPFHAAAIHADPYNEITLDAVFTGPDGTATRVPAFWAGGHDWKIRFAGPACGDYAFETVCSDTGDTGLHGQKGAVRVESYEGENPLINHGRLCVAAGRRHFEHEDGTPFFWLGDTWWMGLSSRLNWPHGFRTLTADRVEKGFNVIQIVAGPYPDMDANDPRGRNEGGLPFCKGFERINPAYYDYADFKIGHLVDAGFVPCIVGMWGYYLPTIGVEKAKRFWRYLVARYGAYPVVWCIAGEGAMAFYLSKTPKEDSQAQVAGWTEVMAHVRAIDPFHNLISIHPTQYGRDQVTRPELMDFEMLQSGHGDLDSVPRAAECVIAAVDREPVMPVVNSEVNYEGILGRCWQNIQRLCFYASVLNGAAGHTYGANGIWQMSTKDKPYGPSPHGRCWGNTPWQEACHLPGSRQVGLGGAFMRRFPWWALQRHPEWVEPAWEPESAYTCTTAGIPGKLRVVYVPMLWDPPLVKDIEPNVRYEAFYFDPCTGAEIPLGLVKPGEDGSWRPPLPPEVHDWLLILSTRQRPKGLAKALLEEGVISPAQLQEALALQREQGGFIGQLLVELGYVEQDVIVLFLVEHFQTPHLNLSDYKISEEIAAIVPKEICLERHVLPINKLGSVLTIAMTDPLDIDALEEVQRACPNLQIKPVLCNWLDFKAVADRLFGPAQ